MSSGVRVIGTKVSGLVSSIQAATGPVSSGVCQVCGEEREFKNYVEASTWGDDKGASRTKKAAKETVADSVETEAEE